MGRVGHPVAERLGARHGDSVGDCVEDVEPGCPAAGSSEATTPARPATSTTIRIEGTGTEKVETKLEGRAPTTPYPNSRPSPTPSVAPNSATSAASNLTMRRT